MYDVTNAESFNNVTIWLNEITKHNENVSKLLVGNKSDLDSNRAVTFEQGQAMNFNSSSLIPLLISFFIVGIGQVDGNRIY